jgi:hypothetical protein
MPALCVTTSPSSRNQMPTFAPSSFSSTTSGSDQVDDRDTVAVVAFCRPEPSMCAVRGISNSVHDVCRVLYRRGRAAC